MVVVSSVSTAEDGDSVPPLPCVYEVVGPSLG